MPLVGAEGYAARGTGGTLHRRATSGLHVARIEHLLGRYGTLIDEVLELIAADPTLGEPLAGAEDYLRVEVVYACTHEGARHLDDVLARRTRISIETWDRGVRAAPAAAELMAGVLGWDAGAGEEGGRRLPGPGRRRGRRSQRSPTTRPPTPSASAPPRSSPRPLTAWRCRSG